MFSSYELRQIENYKSILSELKDLSGFTDNKGSELILKFTEHKKNSLQIISDIVKKVIKQAKSN
jgi:hypothetical protein